MGRKDGSLVRVELVKMRKGCGLEGGAAALGREE